MGTCRTSGDVRFRAACGGRVDLIRSLSPIAIYEYTPQCGGSEVRVILAADPRCGLLHQGHTGSISCQCPSISKFANERVAKWCELRNRDTSGVRGNVWGNSEQDTLRRVSESIKACNVSRADARAARFVWREGRGSRKCSRIRRRRCNSERRNGENNVARQPNIPRRFRLW